MHGGSRIPRRCQPESCTRQLPSRNLGAPDDLRGSVCRMLRKRNIACRWRYPGASFGPWTRVCSQFRRWSRNGTWATGPARGRARRMGGPRRHPRWSSSTAGERRLIRGRAWLASGRDSEVRIPCLLGHRTPPVGITDVVTRG
ncbi:hypothetical protein ETU37_02045 [Nocardioides iriomotensis]|uniref:Transposase n=1 Tax=Nocardioides iriomotensis TaxID=715784 RepID=A0A4Q5J7W4_9ACTN|nr:hypothetical protein ETU37_02045 [Nocardioides iriomotensis]